MVRYKGLGNVMYSMPEIIQELGNVFIVREDDGTTSQKPKTEKNKLLYKYNMTNLFKNNEAFEYETNKGDSVRIKQLTDDAGFQITVNDKYPIITNRSRSADVLKGIRFIKEEDDISKIERIYDEIYNTQVRRNVINKTEKMFKGKVIPESDGWNILGMFKLTWSGDVFLQDKSEQVHIVRGGETVESDKDFNFLDLRVPTDEVEDIDTLQIQVSGTINKDDMESEKLVDVVECPSCQCNEVTSYKTDSLDIVKELYMCDNCSTIWKEYELTDREIEFLSKAQWLVNHRDYLDDDAFWDVIESYVRS